MAKRITFIEIADRKYPLSFSLGVLKAITAKSGGVDKMADLFVDENGEMRASHIDNVTWMLATMMKSGAAYLNMFGEGQPEEGAALDKDGKYIALTQEELELLLDIDDVMGAIGVINEAMASSQETDIETKVEGESKNEEDPHIR